MQEAAAAGRFSCPAEVVRTWPGGRHGNDCEDFRAIEVVPTADEIAPGVRAPFLPQADGSDQFLGWQVWFQFTRIEGPWCLCVAPGNIATHVGCTCVTYAWTATPGVHA